FTPFDNAAVRWVVLDSVDQEAVMVAIAGAEPRLGKIDVGLFAPGTPMASDVGIEITRRPDDYERMKEELVAAGYRKERVVVLGCSTIPSIYAMSQIATDVLQRIG